MLIDPQIDIALIAIVLSSVSQIMSRKFIDRKKMKEYREKTKQDQQKIKEFLKNNDEKSKQEAARLQQEMLAGMSDQMKGSMRLLMFSMVLFIPAFALVRWLYGEVVISLPIPIPWFGGEGESLIRLYNETNWLGWYILCSLVLSMVINLAFKVVDMRKR